MRINYFFIYVIVTVINISFYGCGTAPENAAQAKALVVLSGKYIEKNDYEKALKSAHEAEKYDSMSSAVYEAQAVAYEKLGNYDKAIESWHKCVFSQDFDKGRRGEVEEKLRMIKRLKEAEFSNDV